MFNLIVVPILTVLVADVIGEAAEGRLVCVTDGQAENLTDRVYPNSKCDDSYEVNFKTITLKGTRAPRMFLAQGEELLIVNTKTESISWVMNMAKLGKFWNGALYMTYVNFTDPKQAMLYCDANAPTNGARNGLWCYEMDLAEGNTCGFHSTSHGCKPRAYPAHDVDIDLHKTDTFGPHGVNSICYAWGSAASFGGTPSNNKITNTATGADVPFKGAYGSGVGNIINTDKEFRAEVVFHWEGDNFEGWTQTLSQDGKSISTTQKTDNRFGWQKDGKFALLVQLWESKGLPDWLSGQDCTSGKNPPSTSYDEMELQIRDITITSHLDNAKKVLTFPSTPANVVV